MTASGRSTHRRNFLKMRVLMLLLLGTLLGCGSNSNGAAGSVEDVEDGHMNPVEPDSGADLHDAMGQTHHITVEGGVAVGDAIEGNTIHIFATHNPNKSVFLEWEGDTEVLDAVNEWHTTLTMPARDLSLRANTNAFGLSWTVVPFRGTPERAEKTLRYAIPDSPIGLILFHHGTGGNSSFVTKPESQAFLAVAYQRGYGVIGFEAEESVIGDQNGDNKARWDTTLSANNVDLANVNALVAFLHEQTNLANLPLFAVGMSNGGAFSIALGAVSASSVSDTFPALRFSAVISYCAVGKTNHAQITTTPTAWWMCENDTNESVASNGNVEGARERSDQLTSRGVDSEAAAHPSSPLYPLRFIRIDGVSADDSRATFDELLAMDAIDETGALIQPPAEIAAQVADAPSLLPTAASWSSADRIALLGQLKVTFADHQFFGDWTDKSLSFLDRHR